MEDIKGKREEESDYLKRDKAGGWILVISIMFWLVFMVFAIISRFAN